MSSPAAAGPELFGIPLEFGLFVTTLLGVALFHKHTLRVALAGLAAIVVYGLALKDLNLVAHVQHEWVILANLLGLLLGFAILADHFEASHVPAVLPRVLPDDWKGPFA